MNIAAKIKKISVMLSGISLLLLGACSYGKKEKMTVNGVDTIEVTIARASDMQQNDINVSGQIEASQTANISTRIMGFVTALKVKVGDHVSDGQLLATISNQDILSKRAQTDAMIGEAQAAVNSAQKDVDRFTVLYKQQSATAKELDNVMLQFAAAKSRLEGARQMRNEVNASLGYTSLAAPFAGVVTQKLTEVGSMANPGMPILTIEQNANYQVSASVPENEIRQIQLGAEGMVSIKSIDKIFKGSVSQINPSSQFTGGQYTIKLAIPDSVRKGLYAGMYATVSIPIKKPAAVNTAGEALLVPAYSIEHKDQLTGLYTIGSNNTALLRWVRLGKTYGDKVEVLSGLEKNEQFIVTSEGKLYNGIPVKVK